jgi:hypothetical protein
MDKVELSLGEIIEAHRFHRGGLQILLLEVSSPRNNKAGNAGATGNNASLSELAAGRNPEL